MSTFFNVEVDGCNYSVKVDEDNYEGHAIVLIESLKAFAGMSHRQAVELYTKSWKSVRVDRFGIEKAGIWITEGRPVDIPDLEMQSTRTLSDDQFRAYWRGDDY
jgi:hypothetical protein